MQELKRGGEVFITKKRRREETGEIFSKKERQEPKTRGRKRRKD